MYPPSISEKNNYKGYTVQCKWCHTFAIESVIQAQSLLIYHDLLIGIEQVTTSATSSSSSLLVLNHFNSWTWPLTQSSISDDCIPNRRLLPQSKYDLYISTEMFDVLSDSSASGQLVVDPAQFFSSSSHSLTISICRRSSLKMGNYAILHAGVFTIVKSCRIVENAKF